MTPAAWWREQRRLFPALFGCAGGLLVPAIVGFVVGWLIGFVFTR